MMNRPKGFYALTYYNHVKKPLEALKHSSTETMPKWLLHHEFAEECWDYKDCTNWFQIKACAVSSLLLATFFFVVLPTGVLALVLYILMLMGLKICLSVIGFIVGLIFVPIIFWKAVDFFLVKGISLKKVVDALSKEVEEKDGNS
jgi:hypothetical protein